MNSSALARVHTIVSEMNNQAYNEGVKFEQARIIKLLEPLAKHEDECYHQGQIVCWAEECVAEIYGYAIKKIKGEKQ